jgi:TrmH family RNA methyltransferase
MLLISSKHNPQYKTALALVQEAKARREAQQFMIEGLHALNMAQAQGAAVAWVLVRASAQTKPEVLTTLASLPAAAKVFALDDALLGSLSDLTTPPEIMACVHKPQPVVLDVDAKASVLLLECIQDPGNMGSILRSAVAAGITQVYLTVGCVDVFSPKVLRAGMGAHFLVTCHERVDALAMLAAFEGVSVVLDLQTEHDLFSSDLRGPMCFVFGNEGQGVSDALKAACDLRLKIPMIGAIDSLNVGVAAGICLFEQLRQKQSRA